MARIRTIKPEFFTSSDIVSLTPLARLFYVSLWCEADREGRLNWNTKTFKIRYFPADECDIDALSKEILDAGLVYLYESDGRQYGEIPCFKNHQVINNREADSVIPARVKEACKRVLGEGRKEGKERKGTDVEETSDGFAEFWSAYPKKVGKGDAEKAWKKLKPDLSACLSAISTAKLSIDWLKEGGQFIPHPATWINGKRWEDGAAVRVNGQPALPEFMRGAL